MAKSIVKKLWVRQMLEDWHNYSLRYKEWLEDAVDESEVLPEDRAEVYYLEARRRSLWRRLLNLQAAWCGPNGSMILVTHNR